MSQLANIPLDEECVTCIKRTVDACPDEIVLTLGLLYLNHDYYIVIMDKFGNNYTTKQQINNSGQMHIPVKGNTDFPTGLFTANAGSFYLIIKDHPNDNTRKQFMESGEQSSCIILKFE